MRRFEEEKVDELERKEVAFRLIVHMLGGEGGLETEQVGKVRNAAARQVRSLTDFLKVRFFPSFVPLCVDACCALLIVVVMACRLESGTGGSKAHSSGQG